MSSEKHHLVENDRHKTHKHIETAMFLAGVVFTACLMRKSCVVHWNISV